MASVKFKALVTVSMWNGAAGSYQQLGRTYILALRQAGGTVITVIGPNRQPVLGLRVTAQVDWAIQRDVYCTFVCDRGARWLVLFDSMQEARLFTLLAVSEKVVSGEALTIVEVEGASRVSGRCTVRFSCYDVSSGTMDAVMQEEAVDVGVDDETPLRAVAKGYSAGCVCLVRFSPTVIALAEVPAGEDVLPPLPAGDDGPRASLAKRDRVVAPERVVADLPPVQPQQLAAPAPAPTQAVESAATTGAGARVVREEEPRQAEIARAGRTVQPTPMYEAQLEAIRSEVATKFTELSAMIAGLRRQQQTRPSAEVRGELLVASVRRLLQENAAKDALIREKQQLIGLLEARQTDTRERDALRAQIAESTAKLATQRAETARQRAEHERLSHEISELEGAIARAKTDGELRIARLASELDSERQRETEEAERQRRSLEAQAQQAEAELAAVRERLAKMQAENALLKEQAGRDFGAELAQMKKQLPAVLQRTVRKFVSGVYSLLAGHFEEDEEYDGVAVGRAVRAALERQARTMLAELEEGDES